MRNTTSEDRAAANGTTKSQILPVANATTPYWRSEPHDIDEYRSTEDLPSQCDIAIIGSGMSGVSTAYHLTQQTAEEQTPSIVMLEARQVCSGATGRNGGHVKMLVPGVMDRVEKYGLENAGEIVDLIREQPYAIKAVVETEGLDCEFELRRSFDVFLDSDDAVKVGRQVSGCVKEGQKWTRDTSFVDERYAEQVTSLHGAKAAFTGPACSLWPYKFVSQLLARLVQKKAVNLQTNTPVTEVTESDGWNVLHTSRGFLKAKKVIFASNAYSAGILPSYEGTIIPTRATASHITPKTPMAPHLSHTYNITFSSPNGIAQTDYLNPRPDGSIVVGGGQWTYNTDKSKWYNVWDDSVILEEARPHFEGLMQRHFRGWEDSGAKLDGLWTGIIGTTSDGMPHIGEIPGSARSRYIIAGFNGGGMAYIFLCARGLAKMVLDDAPFEEVGLPRVFKTTQDRLK